MCGHETFRIPDYSAFEDDDELWDDIGLEPLTSEQMFPFEAVGKYLVESGKLGFLVEFETPIPQEFNGETYSVSWLWTTKKWFYGETMEETFEAAKSWKTFIIVEHGTNAMMKVRHDRKGEKTEEKERIEE